MLSSGSPFVQWVAVVRVWLHKPKKQNCKNAAQPVHIRTRSRGRKPNDLHVPTKKKRIKMSGFDSSTISPLSSQACMSGKQGGTVYARATGQMIRALANWFVLVAGGRETVEALNCTDRPRMPATFQVARVLVFRRMHSVLSPSPDAE